MKKTIFDTDIGRLMVLLLPCVLRKVGTMSLLSALSAPLTELLSKIKDTHTDIEHRALYNGQVCRMQMLLNDALDDEIRAIRVVDGDLITGSAYFLYQRGIDRGRNDAIKARGADNQVLLPTRAASMKTKYDFTVEVPERLLPKSDQTIMQRNLRILTALVNTYKLPSTKWNIHTTRC